MISSPIRLLPPLLIIEDSNEDFDVLHQFVQRSSLLVPIYRCVNGEQALAFLQHTGSYTEHETAPRPGLIILDLNLPGMDGREFLRNVKLDQHLQTIPIVIFSTSDNPRDVLSCYQAGANSYIVKPINFLELKRKIQLIIDYWYEVTLLPTRL
jgi:CheY-like chemotaxis protein